jgi:hypothetical protein
MSPLQLVAELNVGRRALLCSNWYSARVKGCSSSWQCADCCPGGSLHSSAYPTTGCTRLSGPDGCSDCVMRHGMLRVERSTALVRCLLVLWWSIHTDAQRSMSSAENRCLVRCLERWYRESVEASRHSVLLEKVSSFSQRRQPDLSDVSYRIRQFYIEPPLQWNSKDSLLGDD